MQNPYANKNKLPHDSPMFFGRDAEIRNIRASLCKAYPESVSVIGERRIGKSSLADRIFHNFDTAPDTLSVFLDFDELSGHCNSQDEFFRQINSRFSKNLRKASYSEMICILIQNMNPTFPSDSRIMVV